MVTRIPVSCNKDCGGGCPLVADVEDGRLARIRDNPVGGPYMNGCVRGYEMPRTLYAPDRLRRPVVRTGPKGSGQFREVSWPEALDRVAMGLSGIRDRYGPESIIRLGGSGSCRGALHNTGLLTRRFLGMFGGYTETVSNYSSAAAEFATRYVLGTKLAGIDPGTLQFSKMIVLWGANISDTRLGCEWTARIREAKRKGVPVVVIDPRRTVTVEQLASRWIPTLPGTDSAFMMAVLHVLITEGLVDREFVESHSVGFPEVERHILGLDSGEARSPAWAEGLCGVPAATIAGFAREYGRTKPLALIPGLSIQRTIGGEEAFRMSIALQVATGNLGRPGGSSGGITWGRLPPPKCGVIGTGTYSGGPSVPVVRWPDAILGGRGAGYPTDLAAIYNVGGNFLVQGSDVHKSVRAFERVEFAVCHDYFMTTTAQYCDVVLPTTTYLERQDIVFPADNYLLFSNRAVPPQAEARNDYDIFCEIADRLGFADEFSEGRDEEQWLARFVAASEVPDYEEFKRTGIYMGMDQLRVGLADFAADPMAHPLRTPSGKVQLTSAEYAKTGGSSVPSCRILPVTASHPLRLITPHPRFRTHSQSYNIPSLKRLDEDAVLIHPSDAEARGIGDGALVGVSSPEGRVRVRARVTEDIMAGVVSLLEGAWPAFEPDGVETNGSANVLTSTEPTLPSQATRTHSVLVQVELA